MHLPYSFVDRLSTVLNPNGDKSDVEVNGNLSLEDQGTGLFMEPANNILVVLPGGTVILLSL